MILEIVISPASSQWMEAPCQRARGQMGELERILHLFASLQILFGSRRGGIGVPLLLIGLLVGGWLLYRAYFDAPSQLSKADTRWDTGDPRERMAAIKEYKLLLAKRDPVEPTLYWLKNDRRERDRLYRRIIEYHVIYDIDKSDANDWVQAAWNENIRDLTFSDERVTLFWNEAVQRIKSRLTDADPAPQLN